MAATTDNVATSPKTVSVKVKTRRGRANTDGDLQKRSSKSDAQVAWPQTGDPWLDLYGAYPPMFPPHPYMGHMGMPPYMFPPMPFPHPAMAAMAGHGYPPMGMYGDPAGYAAFAAGAEGKGGRRRANTMPGNQARPRAGSDKNDTPKDDKPKELPTINEEEATTVMLRNIPNKYTRSMLIALVEEQGFTSEFDFVYLPMDFRQAVNLGYAFVNLLSHDKAMKFKGVFQDFSKWSSESSKTGEVSWAIPHQGLTENVERYRNSPVMHPTMPEEYKPLAFKDGKSIEFPKPTKVIRAPKLRTAPA